MLAITTILSSNTALCLFEKNVSTPPRCLAIPLPVQHALHLGTPHLSPTPISHLSFRLVWSRMFSYSVTTLHLYLSDSVATSIPSIIDISLGIDEIYCLPWNSMISFLYVMHTV